MKRDLPQRGAKKTKVQGYHPPLCFLRLFAATIFWAIGLLGTGQALAAEASLALAADLFAESNWPACRLECQRQLQEFSALPGSAGLLKALAEQRMGLDSREALRVLAEDPAVPPTVALTARYEWARAMWRVGDWRSAFDGFRQVFDKTEVTELSVRSGCSLALLLHQHSELAKDYPEVKPQVRTLRALYTWDIIDECRMALDQTTDSWWGLPGQWGIAFYRSQIRPALGDRCSLRPNCSEYSRQAFQKHGVLGLALTADRFFREPSVVAAAEHPVDVNGKWYYADPLSDHDWWLEE
ncbi:MAG: membrane protein insertion efficiency factor YidD [Kiritimatiellaeota bacterium]|nr:membrane protein insertion efficiency factor YidD [Kiritimatiellota bacterium]